MARGAMRQRELAVRFALGASRARLARQAFDRISSAITRRSNNRMRSRRVPAASLHRHFPASNPYLNKTQLDLRIICFTIILSILCGRTFRSRSSSAEPGGGMLSGRVPASVSHATGRQWLVVVQIAASMVLLARLLIATCSNVADFGDEIVT